LQGKTLPALAACLTLLAWQLELVDLLTGRLSLDSEEQHLLLNELANALGQPCLCPPNGQLHAACWAGNNGL
jgi:hypothetical protein